MPRGKKRRFRPPQSTGPVTGMAPVTRSRSRAAGSAQSRRRRGMPTTEEAAAADSSVAQVVATAAEAPATAVVAQASTAAAEETAAAVIGAQMVATDSTDSAEKTTVGAFVPNSPIRKPRLVEYDSDGEELSEPAIFPDPEQYAEYKEAEQIYSKKIGQLKELPTLDNIYIDAEPIQEKAEDTILKAAKSVLGLSSYIDGELLNNCSGILIWWDKGTGTILITTDLLCSSSPNVDDWLDGKEYAENAEVLVHLLHMNGTEVKGKVDYLDKQYGFALISAVMDQPSELAHAHLSEKVEFGQDVILLGRDKLYLKISDGKVLRKGADLYQRHHYMYYKACNDFGFGRAVIDLEGAVIGMVANSLCFISSSTIQKCLYLWKKFSVVPRIHLGMKLLGIKCLNLRSKERISWKYNVNAGLIVQEVSGESNAEKVGVRMGDIVQSVNGKCIATAVELENMMLDICKDHMEKGTGIKTDANVMVTLRVFNTTKSVPGEIELTEKLSHKVEIIARGERLILPRQKKPVQASSNSQ